jgi:hypothetical protein
VARELNHRCRGCPNSYGACRGLRDAKPALEACSFRKRRQVFDSINGLARVPIQAWTVHTQRQLEIARRLAVETWLQRNGVITITQNRKVLPISPE